MLLEGTSGRVFLHACVWGFVCMFGYQQLQWGCEHQGLMCPWATGKSEDPGPATVYTYVISTGVFILINQERNRIRPFVLVVFEWVWCGFVSVLTCMVNHTNIYIHTERERENTCWEYMLSFITGWTWGYVAAAALSLLGYQTWQFLKNSPLGSEIIRCCNQHGQNTADYSAAQSKLHWSKWLFIACCRWWPNTV